MEEHMGKNAQTDFLFAQPSFASGIARTLDLWAQFDDYNQSETGTEADASAIASDWIVIGQDMTEALEEFDPIEQLDESEELELV
jgi:hypothetical protein